MGSPLTGDADAVAAGFAAFADLGADHLIVALDPTTPEALARLARGARPLPRPLTATGPGLEDPFAPGGVIRLEREYEDVLPGQPQGRRAGATPSATMTGAVRTAGRAS